jgi:hypothetical protein
LPDIELLVLAAALEAVDELVELVELELPQAATASEQNNIAAIGASRRVLGWALVML